MIFISFLTIYILAAIGLSLYNLGRKHSFVCDYEKAYIKGYNKSYKDHYRSGFRAGYNQAQKAYHIEAA